jgi:hypothetical protein
MKENQWLKMFEEALDLLKSSKSVDDLRNIGDKWVDLQVEALKLNLETLKKINQMPAGEKMQEFQVAVENNNQMMETMNKMGEEGMRFEKIPDAMDLLNELGDRAQELSGSVFGEIEEQMNQLMDSVMGGDM